MKKYQMVYWYHCSKVFEIEANSEEEATEKLRNQIESGEIDISNFDIGDDGIECNGEIEGDEE